LREAFDSALRMGAIDRVAKEADVPDADRHSHSLVFLSDDRMHFPKRRPWAACTPSGASLLTWCRCRKGLVTFVGPLACGEPFRSLAGPHEAALTLRLPLPS
jgi:hypothetical protein